MFADTVTCDDRSDRETGKLSLCRMCRKLEVIASCFTGRTQSNPPQAELNQFSLIIVSSEVKKGTWPDTVKSSGVGDGNYQNPHQNTKKNHC